MFWRIFMPNIKERILADARSRKPRYADRMEIFEPKLEDLPAGLTHYSINISQLFDYIPINYIVIGEEFYTSLNKGDFSRLLARVRFLEEKKFSATDLAILYMLLEHSSRDHRIVEKAEDIALPETANAATRQKLAQTITPPVIEKIDGRVECSFYCFNNRTSTLERFRVKINSNYNIDSETGEECY
jgi:hypothetical protein